MKAELYDLGGMMLNENRSEATESWLNEQAGEGNSARERRRVKLNDFGIGSEILVYVPKGDISKRIDECREIQKRRGKKFSVEQILLDKELIAEAGIEWEEKVYTLVEDLSEKLENPAFQRTLSVPVLAIDEKTGENIEAKMLVPLSRKISKKDALKAMKRFRQECFFFTFLNNKYIPSIKGIVAKKVQGGVIIPFIGLATKHIYGTERDSYTLDQLIKAADGFSEGEVISIVQPIANALRTIHNDFRDDDEFYTVTKASLVHRNINPSIIRIIQNGELYISDFGLAKIISEEEDIQMGGEQTMVGTIVGDIRYISWEQAHGVDSSKLTPTTDIYSLCVIAHEMMRGKSPYNTLDPLELMNRVKDNQFTRLTEVAELRKKWGLGVLDMVDSGMVMNYKMRMPIANIKGRAYRWAARFEETMKLFAEQKPVPNLLDEQGNYSEAKAAKVRSSMVMV